MPIDNDFIEYLYKKHQDIAWFPPTQSICEFSNGVLNVLFPELSMSNRYYTSSQEIGNDLETLKHQLIQILQAIESRLEGSAKKLADTLFDQLPDIHDQLKKDTEVIISGDPAANNEYEVVRAYPGFYAIAFYRLARALYKLNVPLVPRILTEYAHSRTGIDIHPGADIAPYFFIDHGTGIVIGETTVIGKYVKLYQGVTLGALSVSKDMTNIKRHPTIEDNVIIYAGATILGGETVIGKNSIIGGNAWLTKSVPEHSIVYNKPRIEFDQKKEETFKSE